MKVKIIYTEVQYYKSETTIEMSKKEYKEYLKKSNDELDREFDLSSNCGDDCFELMEIQNVILEPTK